jgi:hypothetical protein
MALGNLGKVLADQAIEATKRNVLGSLAGPEPTKAAESTPAKTAVVEIGPIILGQLQGMQKSLRDDQELRVEFYTGTESMCWRFSCLRLRCLYFQAQIHPESMPCG